MRIRIREIVREKNFRIELVETEELIGFIIVYRNRRIYLPPTINGEKIPLPIKYAKLFDRVVFPEIVAVPYGRRE